MNIASIRNLSDDELITYAYNIPVLSDDLILIAELTDRLTNKCDYIWLMESAHEEAMDEAQEDIDRVTSDYDEALQDIYELQDEVEELKKELESTRTILNDYVEAEYGGDS